METPVRTRDISVSGRSGYGWVRYSPLSSSSPAPLSCQCIWSVRGQCSGYVFLKQKGCK